MCLSSLLLCAMQFPRLYNASVALSQLADYPLPWEKYKHVKKFIDSVKETEAFKNTEYGEEQIIEGWKPKMQQ
jgi:hypothetical protein